MGEFDTIRPYNDSEVPAVLARLFSDKAFLDILTHFRFPRFAGALGWLLKPMIARKLRREFAGVTTVATLQDKVEYYVDHTIDRATDGVTYTGVEQLKSGTAYLFLANHRDIVMDPAFVNYAVYHAGLPTPRIAIGDNLLQKPFVSDLMRLNKSFIVHRSITGRREKLAAYQLLSAYINHSIRNDCQSIWIAQAEGRAKDGDDRTDSAILKMFHMSRKDEPFAEVIRSLLDDPDLLSDNRLAEGPRQREGVGIIEAPRGTLIHHYRVGDDDLVSYCNLIVSTTHNNQAMNEAVRQVARRYLDGRQLTEGLLNHIEVAIRAFDPCLSCATHALGKMPLAVELVDAEGRLVHSLSRS